MSNRPNSWVMNLSKRDLEKELDALLPFGEWYECEDPSNDVLLKMGTELGLKLRGRNSKVSHRLENALRRMDRKYLLLRERQTTNGDTIITGILLLKHVRE